MQEKTAKNVSEVEKNDNGNKHLYVVRAIRYDILNDFYINREAYEKP